MAQGPARGSVLIHRQRAGPVSLPCGVTAVAGKMVKAVWLFITVVTVVSEAVMGPQLLPNDRRGQAGTVITNSGSTTHSFFSRSFK